MGLYIHWKICQHYNVPYSKTWHEQKPQKYVESEGATILWDVLIPTDKTIQDINIRDHKEETCKPTDFLCKLIIFRMDINISAKEFQKLSKYKGLQIEVDRVWQLKTSIIPIVAGVLELVKKGTVLQGKGTS